MTEFYENSNSNISISDSTHVWIPWSWSVDPQL